MSAPSPVEVDERIRSLTAELAEQSRRLADARSGLARSERQWASTAREAVAAATDKAEKGLGRDRKAIEANAEELRSSALAVASRMLERHAPSYLSAGWDDESWTELPPGRPGEWLRVGTTGTGAGELPLTLPLSAGVWRVLGPAAGSFRGLVQNVVARAVAAFDPTRVRVLAYDPGLGLDLAAFAGLRTVSPAGVPPAITVEEDFEHALEALLTEITAVDDRLTAAGQDTYWKALAAGHALAGSIPLRLLIVGDDPQRLTDRGRHRLDQVRRLAADRGVLVVECAERPAPDDDGRQITITLGDRTATADKVPGIDWVPDPWAGDEFVRRLSTGLAGRPRESAAPTVDFEDIIAALDDPWMSDADEGVEAVIGARDGGDLILRLRSENPPMPNALIGGAVGQGKSNLLLVLIHSLAARYSPAELEMVLVDLRDGVEFARLGPGPGRLAWLPHVRALGLEFDPDYCTAVLQWVRAQMSDRSELLKANDVTTLKAYHEQTGRVLPRLLVVIDEFQRLFEGDDERAAERASLLEGIARTGRGFGIHLVLASQAITGIRGLATKAEAIFGQFHNRVMLRNTPAESQAFLSPQNLAPTELEHRGEVVLNDSLGALEANGIGTVAYADPDYLERLRARLFQQGHGEPPGLFRASAFASWPADAPVADGRDGVAATVGLPIALEAAPRSVRLSRAPNQALAVVGTDRAVAIPVFLRAAATAARSLGAGARVTVLDAEGQPGAPSPWIAALVDHMESHGAAVERVERDGIASKLVEIGRQSGAVDLVVAPALDSVSLDTPADPDYGMPDESLRELVKGGPLHGTWTIGWWQSASVLEEHLGYRAPGIRAWAFCGVSHDDLTSICGPAARQPSGSPRFLWFDRTAGAGTETLVPFADTDICRL